MKCTVLRTVSFLLLIGISTITANTWQYDYESSDYTAPYPIDNDLAIYPLEAEGEDINDSTARGNMGVELLPVVVMRQKESEESDISTQSSASAPAPPEPEVSEEVIEELPVKNASRIVGGRRISIEEAPWQAALIRDRTYLCGAAVVSGYWVLTAAHCVYGGAESRFSVRAGSESFRTGGQLRSVNLIVMHRNFNFRTAANDIALLRVRRHFIFGRSVQPARLPRQGSHAPKQLFVAGWGTMNDNSENPTQNLRGVTLDLVSTKKCSRSYPANQNLQISTNNFCTAVKGRDACHGDSGGPLVNGNVVYGVVSFSIGCARPEHPSVNICVRAYREWMHFVVRSFTKVITPPGGMQFLQS